jgi:hypothetical protein
MKKLFLTIFTTAVLFSQGALFAHAQNSPDLNITPAVIDEKVESRDILKENITLKNNTNHLLELYPSVNDVDKTSGAQRFSRASDSQGLSNSLANWIELTRGMVQLGPGEEKSVPFVIRINQNAVSDSYHAQIIFTEGVTRAEADARPPLGTLDVNVEVKANVKELLQLNKFTTGNLFLSGDDVVLNYELQNIGNQELQPKGHVSIYNRRGEEVATLDVNKDGKSISPEQQAELASVWSATNAFGRYKALLTVDYGAGGTATVQDTVFFWVVPWKQMLIMFIASLVTIIVLALYFHNWLERRHLYKFAHAGLLNDHTLQKINEVDDSPTMMQVTAPLPLFAPEPVVKAPKQKRSFKLFKRKAKKEVVTPQVEAYVEQQVESRHETFALIATQTRASGYERRSNQP